MDQVSCVGNEPELTWCQHNGWSRHNCVHDEDVGVCCQGRSETAQAPSTNPPEPPLESVSECMYLPAAAQSPSSRDARLRARMRVPWSTWQVVD